MTFPAADMRLVGMAAALGSAFAWALGSILYKRIGEEIDAQSMNLVKSALGAVILAAALAVSGAAHVSAGSLFWLGISGILGITIGDTLFFGALQQLGAHTLVSLSMGGQALLVLGAVLLLGETPGPYTWTGILLVLGGVSAVVLSRVSDDRSRNTFRGVVSGSLSAVAMAGGILLAKKALADTPALEATCIRMAAGVGGLCVWGMARGRFAAWAAPLADLRLMRKIFLAVCVATLGGFWLFHVAVKYTDVSVANPLSAMEPVFVLPLAALLLKERVRWPAVAGTVAAVCGVVCIFRG